MYVSEGWCTNCGLVKSNCSEAIELMTMKCRAYYLPWKFTAVFVTIVYILPGANANEALKELHDTPLSVTTADVRKTLQGINPRKAAGPDNIPGRVLRDCAHQLSEVLADIFNTSLSLASFPTSLKTATIVLSLSP